ncbi:hypothetical protein EV356DRAFT_499559 [Viridothelium virens]|uniref:Uncharacterized protein n=1 Tax=Viridothelium virens TaxID=1048519 RepID=A0A6A6HMX0_VIRVR|nr:hypothetical protein EV356DRAFT_499559 [Viridothelium virens]
MLGNEEEINGIESDGLLGQPGIFSRKRHRHARLLHIFFVSALVLNIFLAGFGLAYWLFNERTVGTSYETGFASDLSKYTIPDSHHHCLR